MPDFFAEGRAWLRGRITEIVCLIVALSLCCSFFLTELMVHDHTFRNSLIQSFPSYRTAAEGRWGHDIVIFLMGRSGNFGLQNAVAIVILVINGALFAQLMGITRRGERIAITALIASSPLFLDYFSFSVDAISYSLGDMLVLLGFLLLSNRIKAAQGIQKTLDKSAKPLAGLMRMAPVSVAPVILATALFFFAIGIYPPKVSLLAVMGLVFALREVTREGAAAPDIFASIAAALIAVVVAAIAYAASFKVIEFALARDRLGRTDVNSFAEIINAGLGAPGRFIDTLIDYGAAMPVWAAGASLILLLLGAVGLMRSVSRNGLLAIIIGVVALVFAPIAFEFSTLVNSVASSTREARVFIGYAFLLAFFFCFAYRISLRISMIAAVLVAYSGFVTLSQENTAAAMKSMRDVSVLSRVAGRVEPLIEEGDSLYVHGRLTFDDSAYVASASRPFRPHFTEPSLTHWNFVEVVNFHLFGAELSAASPDKSDAARALLAGRPTWPAPGAVFREDGVIIVHLDDEF